MGKYKVGDYVEYNDYVDGDYDDHDHFIAKIRMINEYEVVLDPIKIYVGEDWIQFCCDINNRNLRKAPGYGTKLWKILNE